MLYLSPNHCIVSLLCLRYRAGYMLFSSYSMHLLLNVVIFYSAHIKVRSSCRNLSISSKVVRNNNIYCKAEIWQWSFRKVSPISDHQLIINQVRLIGRQEIAATSTLTIKVSKPIAILCEKNVKTGHMLKLWVFYRRDMWAFVVSTIPCYGDDTGISVFYYQCRYCKWLGFMWCRGISSQNIDLVLLNYSTFAWKELIKILILMLNNNYLRA